MHMSGALLLPACDGNSYNEGLISTGVDTTMQKRTRSASTPHNLHRRENLADAAHDQGAVATAFGSPMGVGVDAHDAMPMDHDDWHDDPDPGGVDEQLEAPMSVAPVPEGTLGRSKASRTAGTLEGGDSGALDEIPFDPFQPLDPHESAGTSKPYKQRVPRIPKCVPAASTLGNCQARASQF